MEDFWKFVQKYQLFQQRRKQPPKPLSTSIYKYYRKTFNYKYFQFIDTDQQRSSILNIPTVYDKKHRLNISITINKSSTDNVPHYDMTGEKIIDHYRLSSARLAELKSIIEYYFDFNQKEKVRKTNIFY